MTAIGHIGIPTLADNSYFSGELRHEFTRICEKTIMLAKKYNREDILLEKEPKEMMGYYLEHTRESNDLKIHLRGMTAWTGSQNQSGEVSSKL